MAETTQPGTAARERMMRDILSGHQQPYIDQALLRRIAELIFTSRAQRA